MDPLHPILPVPVNIPPVMPAPSVGRISRDQRERPRPGPGDEESPDEREQDDERGEGLEEDQDEVSAEELDVAPRRPGRTYDYDPDDEPEGGPHIDITA